ncbi:MAG: diphosphomevalonate decarboxylase [Wenzhouxiangellaceae bacterium]
MSQTSRRAAARAHANIALVKYWGKRDSKLNLPAVGSLSITLDQLTTETEVVFDAQLDGDEVWLNQQREAGTTRKVSATLDLLRAAAECSMPARVSSTNNFPTAAGLASSASGFAALVTAAAAALELDVDQSRLSEWARRGSGSAARSIFGGFVEMAHGELADGSDAIATPLYPAEHWPLQVVIAITSKASKKLGSTDGMDLTMRNSPYYDAWVAGAEADLATASRAVAKRNFEALAEVSEWSCLKMHASALAAVPGVLYWNPATVAGIHRIRELRAAGVPVFFTIDAGPQLKAVCEADAVAAVSAALSDLPGVEELIVCGLGGAAQVIGSSDGC